MQSIIRYTTLLVCSFIISQMTWAATKTYTFSCNTKIIRYGNVSYEYRSHTYNFNVEVVSDNYGYKSEQMLGRHSFIIAYPEERYSITLRNPMPIRVGVSLVIDGLNSIDGRPCDDLSRGRMWLIDPYSTITISGWQVDSNSARRFYFTNIGNSYAQWRSYQLDRDMTVKCGQIQAAFFWSCRDMERHFEYNPIYEGNYHHQAPGIARDRDMTHRKSLEGPRLDAGTGMGEHQGHQVQSRRFHFDTGMYSEQDAIKIFYDFKSPDSYRRRDRHYRPRYNDDGFAPQKPW